MKVKFIRNNQSLKCTEKFLEDNQAQKTHITIIRALEASNTYLCPIESIYWSWGSLMHTNHFVGVAISNQYGIYWVIWRGLVVCTPFNFLSVGPLEGLTQSDAPMIIVSIWQVCVVCWGDTIWLSEALEVFLVILVYFWLESAWYFLYNGSMQCNFVAMFLDINGSLVGSNKGPKNSQNRLMVP